MDTGSSQHYDGPLWRVSTLDQHVENQLTEVARMWSAGAGPRSNTWTEACRVPRTVVQRLMNSSRPLVGGDSMSSSAGGWTAWEESPAPDSAAGRTPGAGIAFVTLGEGIDTATPAGRLQLHILSAIAEFERSRIQERVVAGLARARAQGKRLGRPRLHPRAPGAELNVRDAARVWGVSKSTAARWLAAGKSMDERRSAANAVRSRFSPRLPRRTSGQCRSSYTSLSEVIGPRIHLAVGSIHRTVPA